MYEHVCEKWGSDLLRKVRTVTFRNFKDSVFIIIII